MRFRGLQQPSDMSVIVFNEACGVPSLSRWPRHNEACGVSLYSCVLMGTRSENGLARPGCPRKASGFASRRYLAKQHRWTEKEHGDQEKQKQKKESKSKRKQKRKSRKEDAPLSDYSTIPQDNMIKDKKMPTKVSNLHFQLDQKMPINMLKTCNLFFLSFGDIYINPIRG